uniref:Uncharacterized protein n=1 Tax=Anopheles christyi TaxID=43041 RepID=A0A182KI22_9DIPT
MYRQGYNRSTMKSRRHTVRECKLSAYINTTTTVLMLVPFTFRDEIVHIFRHGFVPFATPSTKARLPTTTTLFINLVRMILQIERFDALARLFQHIRIEREEREVLST